MKAMVTGAAGHLGLCLATRLSEKGHEVTAAMRSPPSPALAERLRLAGISRFAYFDIRDKSRFRQLFEANQVLFHCAATYAYHTGGRTTDDDIVKDSLLGVEAAMEAARGTAQRVVLTSSVVALPLRASGSPKVDETQWQSDFSVPYFRAKAEAEQLAWRLADRYSVPLTTVLPGAIGGPGFLRRTPTIDIIEGIMRGSMRFGAPPGNLDYVDVRDVADAHILALEVGKSERFIVTNDETPTMQELSRLLHEIDRRIPAAPMTMPAFAYGLLPFIDGVNAKIFDYSPILTPAAASAFRKGEFGASNAKAKRDLGWAPRFSLRDSLAATLQTIRTLRSQEGRKS